MLAGSGLPGEGLLYKCAWGDMVLAQLNLCLWLCPVTNACFSCRAVWLRVERHLSEGQGLHVLYTTVLPRPCIQHIAIVTETPGTYPKQRRLPHPPARSTGAAGRPYLGVVFLSLCCPECQEPATPHSDHHPQVAGQEGSGCPLCSKFASVWHSL